MVLFAQSNRPSESFAGIMKFTGFCSALVGADVSNPNFRLNWITAVVVTSIAIYFICSVITIVEMFEEKPTYMVEASCMLGSVLQGVAKLATGCAKTKGIVKLRFQLEHLYALYEKKGSVYCVALNRNSQRSKKIIIIFGWIYLISTLGIVLTPIVIIVVTGKRYLMMHFLVPGLDVKTYHGYIGTMVAHSTCMFAGAFGLFSGDLVVLIFLSHGLMFADIWQLKIQDLNVCIEDECSPEQRRYMMEDLVEWHLSYNDFNELCNTSFYYIIAVQITTSGISIICNLFIVLTGDWPGVYSYMMIPFISLYSYCILGTQIDICNDRFTDEIFNINWYMLPPAEQKLVQMMLLKSQTPNTIQVCGVMPLSVQTALQISKTIYSIFMMMVQFLIK